MTQSENSEPVLRLRRWWRLTTHGSEPTANAHWVTVTAGRGRPSSPGTYSTHRNGRDSPANRGENWTAPCEVWEIGPPFGASCIRWPSNQARRSPQPSRVVGFTSLGVNSCRLPGQPTTSTRATLAQTQDAAARAVLER